MAATAWVVARDVAAKAVLAPALHAAAVRATEVHTAAQVATAHLVAKEVEMAVITGRGLPVNPGRVPSSPTSEHIRMTMAQTQTASIKWPGCRSKGAPSI
ncbi:hypothetical protein D3C78_985430 [compost metagenome]